MEKASKSAVATRFCVFAAIAILSVGALSRAASAMVACPYGYGSFMPPAHAVAPVKGVCPSKTIKVSYCSGQVVFCTPSGTPTPPPTPTTPIPLRAALSATGLTFPDLNMFRSVSNWDTFEIASHGIVGVKVWQSGVGNQKIDAEMLANFTQNFKQALSRKMIIIGYVFGVGGISGATQADTALAMFPPNEVTTATKIVNGVKKTVITDTNPGRIFALDLEGNPDGPSMTDAEAEAFVTRVYQKTGRYPFLYTNLRNMRTTGLLAKCPRWVASYISTPPPATDIWQYTDGVYGPQPHSFSTVGKCDINKTIITYGALRKLAGL